MCNYIFIQNKKHMLSIEACCFIEHVFGKNTSTYVYMSTAVLIWFNSPLHYHMRI